MFLPVISWHGMLLPSSLRSNWFTVLVDFMSGLSKEACVFLVDNVLAVLLLIRCVFLRLRLSRCEQRLLGGTRMEPVVIALDREGIPIVLLVVVVIIWSTNCCYIDDRCCCRSFLGGAVGRSGILFLFLSRFSIKEQGGCCCCCLCGLRWFSLWCCC